MELTRQKIDIHNNVDFQFSTFLSESIEDYLQNEVYLENSCLYNSPLPEYEAFLKNNISGLDKAFIVLPEKPRTTFTEDERDSEDEDEILLKEKLLFRDAGIKNNEQKIQSTKVHNVPSKFAPFKRFVMNNPEPKRKLLDIQSGKKKKKVIKNKINGSDNLSGYLSKKREVSEMNSFYPNNILLNTNRQIPGQNMMKVSSVNQIKKYQQNMKIINGINESMSLPNNFQVYSKQLKKETLETKKDVVGKIKPPEQHRRKIPEKREIFLRNRKVTVNGNRKFTSPPKEIHEVKQKILTKRKRVMHPKIETPKKKRKTKKSKIRSKNSDFPEDISSVVFDLNELRKRLGETKSQKGSLPFEAVEVLKEWFLDHAKDPYPSNADKDELLKITNLTKTQLSNWFTNKRKRAWKPYILEFVSENTELFSKTEQNDSSEEEE